jgi:hypothetical protein
MYATRCDCGYDFQTHTTQQSYAGIDVIAGIDAIPAVGFGPRFYARIIDTVVLFATPPVAAQ